MEDNLTIDQLAALLEICRRTVERAIETGALVPASRTASGRARFSAEQGAALKARADAARALGYKYVIESVMSDGPVLGPRRNRKRPPLTTEQWLRGMRWKRRNLMRLPNERPVRQQRAHT